jgi:hypothetical protein
MSWMPNSPKSKTTRKTDVEYFRPSQQKRRDGRKDRGVSMLTSNMFVMATRNNVVILNLFQDNARPSFAIPNQVRDDENMCDQKSLRLGTS